MVAGTYPPARCGVGRAQSLLSCNLAALGVEVTVVTSAYLGTPYLSGNPTVLPVVESWKSRNARKVVKAILDTQSDIVHFQFPNMEYEPHKLFDFLVPLTKLFRPSGKVVITFHEPLNLVRYLVKGLFRPFRVWVSLCLADGVIVVAESYRKTLHTFSPGTRRVPIKVISNASDIPTSDLSEAELRQLRTELGVSSDGLLLGYFGFTHPGKGFEQLLDVLILLRARRVPSRLLVLGEISEADPYHRKLLTRIREAKLEDNVSVLGFLSDASMVANYLAMCDACVFPFVDGLHPKAVSILAATSQGVFTVTTSKERRGLFEAENVYYTRPGDVAEITSALLLYRGRRVPRGSFCRRTGRDVARETLEFYNELCAFRSS